MEKRTFLRWILMAIIQLHLSSQGYQTAYSLNLEPNNQPLKAGINMSSDNIMAKLDGFWVEQARVGQKNEPNSGRTVENLTQECAVDWKTDGGDVTCDCSYLNLTEVPACSRLPVDCRKIKVLKLIGNRIKSIQPGTFIMFPYLVWLDISGNPMTEPIRDDTFRGLNNLETLIMAPPAGLSLVKHNCSDNAFSEMRKLKYLDISNRYYNIQQLFHRTLYGLSSQIETFRANGVANPQYTMYRGNIMTLNNKTSHCFLHTKLKKLYLESNQITVVKVSFLTNLRHLEYLSLRGNLLDSHLDTLLALPIFMPNLTFLDLGSQHTKGYVWYDDSLEEPIQPWESISRSELSEHECVLKHGSKQLLDFSEFFSFPRLQTLRLDYVPIKTYLDLARYRILFRNNHLVNLDLSYWLITFINSTVPCCFYLKYLNLRGISASSVDPKVFHEMPRLERLVISRSFPANIFRNERFTELLFMKNKNLNYLDISQSEVEVLNTNLISHLWNLRTFIVSGNKISHIGNLFSNHSVIQTVDLSFNQLSKIPIKLLNTLEQAQLKQESIVSLDISGNPFICSCDSVSVLHRVLHSNIKINNLHSDRLYCIMADGNKQNFMATFKQLKNLCHKEDPTFIIVEFFIYILTLMIICGVSLGYRYRWTLKYAWYTALELVNRRGSTSRPSYRFDAFISYCSNDEDWVRNELVRHLEEGRGNQYKLCLHYKHFLPGRAIADNIVSAIQSCRTVVMIVTKNYLRSGWCDFEARLAQQHHLQKHGGGVIAIVHPDARRLLLRRMRTMKAILESVTYLEWPKENREKLFWMRLKSAIGVPVAPSNDQVDYELF